MHKPLKILQASAGSGKTFSLTAHYLTLLFSGPNKYREILAVTFTNKATEEMKTRILQVLKGFAAGEPGFDAYKQLVLAAHPALDGVTLQQRADLTYRKILHDYSRFAVNTIDGFVQKVVRGFAFELGLEAGYALEMNEEKVKNELADRLEKALDAAPELLQWIIDLAKERIENDLSWNYRRELLDLSGEIFKERYQPFENAVAALGKEAALDNVFKDYQLLTKGHIAAFKQAITTLAADAAQLLDVLDLDPAQVKGKSRSPLWNLKKIAGGEFDKIKGLAKLVDEPTEWFAPKAAVPANAFEDLNPMLKELTATYAEGLPAYTTAVGFNKNLFYLRLMQEIAVLLKQYRSENENLLISDAQKLISEITKDAGDNPSFIWEKVGNRYKNFLFDEFKTSVNI
ncbi:MAG: DNA helicase UvrD, partial [Chitinophagaceae bacterium]